MIQALELEHYPFDIHDLPVGWTVVLLGALAVDIQPGFASGVHNSDGLGVPHLRPMNVTGRGEIDLSDLRSVPGNNPLRLRRGDLLFNNTNSPAWVGKTGLVDSDEDLAFSNHMTRIRLEDGIPPEFLAKQLNFLRESGYFLHHCKKHVNQASISSAFLAQSVPVLLPPAAEQRRILAKIKDLQARTRRTRESLEVTPPLMERLRQSVLAAAFRGDLTTDWRARNPAVEPASVLLERIRVERRRQWEEAELAKTRAKGKDAKDDRWKQKYDGPAPVDASELPELPPEWTWVTLDHLTQGHRKISYGVLKPGPHVADGVRFIKSGQIRDGYVDLEDDYRISPELDEQYWRTRLEGGEVLLNLVGASIGRSAVAPLELAGANVTRAIAVIPTFTEVAEWAQLALQGPVGQRLVHSAAGGSAQPVLNLSEVRGLPIPFPPRTELEEIVHRINRAQKLLRTVFTATEEAQSRIDQVDQSILAKAFRGELVPQDPNDEPASMLLERLRVKKALDTRTRSKNHMRKQSTAPRSRERQLVLEVLSNSREPLTPEDLFARCGYNPAVIEDIEGFFSELRELENKERIEELRPDYTTVLLRAVP